MAKTLANVRIYGDDASAVFVGDEGATLPTTLAAPDSDDFTEVGWLSEDGVDGERSLEATSFRAFQGGAIVRRKKTKVEDTFKFVCLEETALVLGLVYAGKTPAVVSSVGTITIDNQTAQDDRSFVIDLVDDAVTKRYTGQSCAIEMSGTISHKNDAMTMYEFTLTPQGDYFLLTNNPAVIA